MSEVSMTTITTEDERISSTPFTILIVEDDAGDTEIMLKAVEQADLRAIGGDIWIEVRATAEGALQLLSERPVDLVLADMMLPGISGLDLVTKIQEIDRNLPVLIVTRVGDVPAAVEAMRRGAFDYLLKPVNPLDLGMRLHRAVRISEIVRRGVAYQRLFEQEMKVGSMVGTSDIFQELMHRVRLASETRSTVLILGETGTGKGMIARSIHEQSRERDKLYQVIDCTTVPESMVESELFGHVRGAFTGAVLDKPGLIELANGGTAFFDEIGELPLPMQAKLLRVLEDSEIRPVGGTRTKRVNLRVIAATNQDLEEKVRHGKFRQDLYYRLAAVEIKVPPLRERPEDIPVLARHLLQRLESEMRKRGCRFDSSAMSELVAYRWPGNVREMRNIVERAVMLAKTECITGGEIKLLLPRRKGLNSPIEVSGSAGEPYIQAKKKIVADFTSAYLKVKLTMANGLMTQAAQSSGINLQYFSLLKKRYLAQDDKL
jgi:two-component system, NtrC family, response regulator AtoC